MASIFYIDRKTKEKKKEKIYGFIFLEIFYGDNFFFQILSRLFLPFFTKIAFFSKFYGFIQKSRMTRWKVAPFIRAYEIDAKEFLEPVMAFRSFNDFFIRKLKPDVRPLAPGDEVAILPADGRYLAFQNFEESDTIFVKGKKFSLEKLLRNDAKTKQFRNGSLIIARLCPVDYHRFHFPCACVPGRAELINGDLYSVNPIALKKNIEILTENKRVITSLKTERFGEVLYIEIGATYVGSIEQTYEPAHSYAKGDEKGYFSFGGSCLILLFEKDRIILDNDLLETTQSQIEMRGLLGQSLGRAP
jgi:phosphatidylserine decarboxylase